MKRIIADAHSDVIEYACNKKMNICDRRLSFNLIDAQDNKPCLQLMACYLGYQLD